MQTHLFLISLLILSLHATSLQRHGSLTVRKSDSTSTLDEGCIRVWAGYIGDNSYPSATLCQDTPDLATYQISKQISAVEVGPNTKVILYSNVNYQGTPFVLSQTDNFVKLQAFNDQAASLIIRNTVIKEGCAIIWAGYIDDYAYPSAYICQSVPDLRTLGIDKQISSVSLGANTMVVLWSNYNYQGNTFSITANDNFNKLQNFNDQTSSVQIKSTLATNTNTTLQEGCIRVWVGYIGDKNYNSAVICKDTPDLRPLGVDKGISAIEVSSSVKVILCSDYNYGGSKFLLTETDNFTKLQTFNDQTSSIFFRNKTIAKGCIVVWAGYIDDYNYPSAVLCQNTPDLRPYGIDKQISSIQLGSVTQATLYSGYTYTGTAFVMSQDDNFVRLQNFNDQTSSIGITVLQSPVVVPQVTLKGTIAYATTGGLIPDAELTSKGLKIIFQSSSGNYTAQVLTGSKYTVTMPSGTYIRTSSLSGFITAVENVNAQNSSNETNSGNTVLFAPIFEGWRFVLSWTQKYDLDSYMKTPNGLVYYKVKATSDQLSKLDIDSRNSTLPETAQSNIKTGQINFYVKAYSGGAISKSGAQVLLYHGSSQVKSWLVPANSDDPAMLWSVCQINADTLAVTDINQLTTITP